MCILSFFYFFPIKIYLTPHEHRSENHLKAVEEVFADYDNRRSAGRPSLARRYRFYTRRLEWQCRIKTYEQKIKQTFPLVPKEYM